MIILQNSSSLVDGKLLDFRFYNYIDINYGIQKGVLIVFRVSWNACRYETDAQAVIDIANRKRLNSRKIIELALEADTKLLTPIRKIIADKAFFKSYKGAAYQKRGTGRVMHEAKEFNIGISGRCCR